MLTQIREKTHGIVAGFIITLIAIPFALWGVNSYFAGDTALIVANVDGIEITQAAYRSALDQYRGRVAPEVLNSRKLKELVVDGLIDQALLIADAQRRGYRFSNAGLNQQIRKLPYFQRDGEFDPRLYEALLRQQGITPATFEEQRRLEAMARQVHEGLRVSAIVSDHDVTQVVRLLAQEREIAYAVISPGSLVAGIEVSAEAVQEYYAAHQEMFTTPERVRIEYIQLSVADLVKQLPPSEAEIEKAYAAEIAHYTTPAKRQARHILIEAPATASPEDVARARARIEDLTQQHGKGADFATLAKKHSQDPVTAEKGGDLGEVSADLLPPELETALKALKPGAVSQPVRTSYGFHVIQLTGYTPEQRRPLAAVRNELLELIRARKGEERFYELSEKFHNIVYEQPDSLKPAADALGLEIHRSEWFGREGGSGIAKEPKVIDAAFSPEVLLERRNSDAIEIKNDTLAALRVLEHRPSVVRALADVRAQVEQNLRRQYAKERTETLSAQWLDELRGGKTLAAVAQERGQAYQGPRRITRERTAGVDGPIVEAAFAARRPKQADAPVYERVDLGDRGYAVVALYSVKEGDPATADPALKQKARRLLTSHRGTDYFTDYRAGLRQEADIKIFRDQL